MSNNRLSEFPFEVCQLTSLRCLFLAGNHITQIPPTLKWTTKCLQRLDLSHNCLGYDSVRLETAENRGRTQEYAFQGTRSSPRSQIVSEPEASRGTSPNQRRVRSVSDSLVHRRVNGAQTAVPSSRSPGTPPPRHPQQSSPSLYRSVFSPLESPASRTKTGSVVPFFKGERDETAASVNGIFSLPSTLRELKLVDISFNFFEDVPLCLCNLMSLAQLNVAGYPIDGICSWIHPSSNRPFCWSL